MKRFFIIFILFIASTIVLQAQNIRSYTVIVKIKGAKTEKGILCNVTTDKLILDNGDGIITVRSEDIRRINIFASKRPYQYKNVLAYDPWEESNFETPVKGQAPVRKWGKEDPSLKEEIGGHIMTVAMNATANLIAAPISRIRGSLFKAKINGDVEKFQELRNDLYYFSIYYQVHSDYGDELKRINVISKNSLK